MTILSEVEISELPLVRKNSATRLGCSASNTAHWSPMIKGRTESRMHAPCEPGSAISVEFLGDPKLRSMPRYLLLSEKQVTAAAFASEPAAEELPHGKG